MRKMNKNVLLLSCILLFSGNIHSASSGFDIYSTTPITSTKILPTQTTVTGLINSEIELQVSPGEIEPISLVVKANSNVESMKIDSSDLISQNVGLIPAEAIDIRVVKAWYQAGVAVYQTDKRLLTPELLLKDDSLVSVDYENKNNYIIANSTKPEEYTLISGGENVDISRIKPNDSLELKPVDIPKDTVKQFWVNVKVPEGTLPGRYNGEISFEPVNQQKKKINISVVVLPIKLDDSKIQYSIYYRGKIGKYLPGDPRLSDHRNNKAVLNSNYKTPDQYRIEMENLKQHGITNPTIYQNDKALFQTEMKIRGDLGLIKDSLFSLGAQTVKPSSASHAKTLKKITTDWIALANKYGVNKLYFYGNDEAKGAALTAQRAGWELIKKEGGYIFTALDKKAFQNVSDILDAGVVLGGLDATEANTYHSKGKKLFSYSNPQVGIEDPYLYRVNYGVALWAAGYDGAMTYAYQHSANNIWNDFDDKKYRDHVFAYPTENGVIDTIQFEGFREAVDDVRYLTTLENLAKESTSLSSLDKEKLKVWFRNINQNSDPARIRQEAILWILKLQNRN